MAEGNHAKRVAGKPSARPPKVLSTTLGVMLAANLAAAPLAHAESTAATSSDQGPKLVEWSTDAVKAFYNPEVDWNIQLSGGTGQTVPSPTPSSTPVQGGTGTAMGNTVIVHDGGGSGFGWDDILLYHFLFNSGGMFSTSSWSRSQPIVYVGTHQTYQPRTYAADQFANRPVKGSTVRPVTSSSSGTFSSKSRSAGTGSIGSRSSSFSSSGHSTGSSFGS